MVFSMNKKKPYLTKKEWKALDEFKRRLRHQVDGNLSFIKLYGSRARGEFYRGSDVDLIVVLKKMGIEIRDILDDIRIDILIKYEIDLEIMCCTLGEYQYYKTIQSPFIQNVERDGIL